MQNQQSDPPSPGWSPLGEYLYVIQFASDVIKVGMSATPGERIKHHGVNARAYGDAIVRQWVSPPHVDTALNERRLLDYCRFNPSARSSPRGNEYFTGLSFDDVVAYASALPIQERHQVDQDRIAAEIAACLDGITDPWEQYMVATAAQSRQNALAEECQRERDRALADLNGDGLSYEKIASMIPGMTRSGVQKAVERGRSSAR